MTNEEPGISVVIPSYNCASTIAITLQSMIDQTYKNLEIIVVDDASTDNTERVVRDYMQKDSRIQYHKIAEEDPTRVNARGRNINAGWRARNVGVQRANGEWVTFQDADDASLLNRIEVQYELAQKHNASHLTIEWLPLEPSLIGKKIDAERYFSDHAHTWVGPQEITKIARRSKGILPKVLGPLHRYIPFKVKQARIINRLFFGTLDTYPGVAGIPLVKKEVFTKVQFRPRDEREWPSFTGRGVDRDFDFKVAEVFKNSVYVEIPLYLYRTEQPQPHLADYIKYIY